MMRDLIAHDVRLFEDLVRKRIAAMGARFVDDDRERRLDRMGKIADMGARTLDNGAVGIEQRIGLARQRRDLSGNSPSSRSACPERIFASEFEIRLSGARPNRT
jgi:hypothetical protein